MTTVPWGATMAEVGLIYPGGPGFLHPIDVPSEKGKELADAFRQAVGSTRYYRDYFDADDVEVPHDVVLDYIQHACLCQLQLPAAPDRPVLLDTFLHAPTPHPATKRRATFRYRFDNDLGFADARFEALSTALHELGLCGWFDRLDRTLTPDGQRLLDEGDLM